MTRDSHPRIAYKRQKPIIIELNCNQMYCHGNTIVKSGSLVNQQTLLEIKTAAIFE